MKKLIPILLILCLLLSACTGTPDPTDPPETDPPVVTAPPETDPPTEPPTEPPTQPPTEEPTEPPVLYRNPLNGQPMDEPYEGRIFAVTINNVTSALPHRGVGQADLYFEMLVNGGMTRGLALFSDIGSVPQVGSIRSSRYPFVDICRAYDAVLCHCGGSNVVLRYMRNSGIDNFHTANTGAAKQDQNRLNNGYAYEDTWFATGEALLASAKKNNMDVTRPAGKDYGLQFAEDGTPAGGDTANVLHISYWGKRSIMTYDAEVGKYTYTQYNRTMIDENTGEKEYFENVIVMQVVVYTDNDAYQISDYNGSGDGYFACNGKIIPIKWHHSGAYEPFTFTLTDGTPLTLGVGSTYIALAPTSSEFTYE